MSGENISTLKYITIDEVKELPNGTPVYAKKVGTAYGRDVYDEDLFIKYKNYLLFTNNKEYAFDLNCESINPGERCEIKCYINENIDVAKDLETSRVHKAFKDIIKAHSSEAFDAAVKDLNEPEIKRILKMTVEYLNILVMNDDSVY